MIYIRIYYLLDQGFDLIHKFITMIDGILINLKTIFVLKDIPCHNKWIIKTLDNPLFNSKYIITYLVKIWLEFVWYLSFLSETWCDSATQCYVMFNI